MAFILGNDLFGKEALPEVTAEERSTSWGDTLKNLGAGLVESTAGTAGSIASYFGAGDGLRQWSNETVADIEKSMNPMARKILQEGMFDGEYSGGFVAKLTSSLTRAVPSVGASVAAAATGVGAVGLAGSAITKVAPLASALRAAGMSPAVSLKIGQIMRGAVVGGTVGAQNMGETVNNIYKYVDGLPEKKLMQNERYRALIDEGLSPTEARAKFREITAGYAPLAVGLLTGALGPIGIEGSLALGTLKKAGIGRAAVRGAGGEAVQEGLESGIGNVATQGQLAKQNLKEFSYGDLIKDIGEGALVGGIIGGGIGAVAGRKGVDPAVGVALNGQLNTPPNAQSSTINTPPPNPPQAPPGVTPQVTPSQDDIDPATQSAWTPPTGPTPVTPAPEQTLNTEPVAEATNTQSAEPVDGTEPMVPEPKVDLLAQAKAVADGTKSVISIPKSGVKYALSDYELRDLGLVQLKNIPAKYGRYYKRKGDTSITGKKVYDAIKTGTLNDLLAMGPTTKTQAVDAQSDQVITRTDENGGRVVEQGTTPETQAEDFASVQQNAAPTDTVSMDSIENVLARREALNTTANEILTGKRVPNTEPPPAPPPPQAAPVQEVTPQVTPTGRVLQDESLDGKKWREIAQKLDLKRLAKVKRHNEAFARSQKRKGKGRGVDEKVIEKRQRLNSIADETIEKFAPTDKEKVGPRTTAAELSVARKVMTERLRDMIKAVKAAANSEKLEFPKQQLAQNLNEKMRWGRGVVLTKMLEGMLPKDPTKSVSASKLYEIQALEADLRAGNVEEVLSERRLEGDLANSKTGDIDSVEQSIGIENVAETEDALIDQIDNGPEQELLSQRTDEEVENILSAANERPKVLVERTSEKIKKKIEATKKLAAEGATEGERNAAAAALERLGKSTNTDPDSARGFYTAGKVSTGFVVQKKRTVKRTVKNKVQPVEKRLFTDDELLAAMNGEIDIQENAQDNVGRNENGREVEVPILSESPLGRFLDKIFRTSAGLKDQSRALLTRRFKQLISDVRVVVVDSNSEILNVDGIPALGYYDPSQDIIVLSEAVTTKQSISDGTFARVILHEAAHAAYSKAINSDYKLFEAIEAIRAEVIKIAEADGVSNVYGLRNAHEFISEVLANPDFQKLLERVTISPEVQSRLERMLPPTIVRSIRNLWQALVAALYTKIRSGKNSQGFDERLYTALDAAMRITEAIDQRAEIQYAASRGKRSIDEAAEIYPILNYQSITDTVLNYTDVRRKSFITWAKETAPKFMTLQQMGIQFRDTIIGPYLEKIVSHTARIRPRINEFVQVGGQLAERAEDLQKRFPKEFQEFVELTQEVRMYEVSLIQPNNFGTDVLSQQQGKAKLPILQAKFSQLGAEIQQFYRDLAKHNADMHEARLESTIYSLIDGFSGAAGSMSSAQKRIIARNIIDGKLDDAIGNALFGETLWKNISNASDFQKVRGDYFPLMRYGDHVVEVEDKISNTYGGVLMPEGDTVEFRGATAAEARRNAKAFIDQTDLTFLSSRKILVDQNGKEITPDEAKSVGLAGGPTSVETRYRVTVQTKGVYFFESIKDATEFVKEASASGLHDTIGAVQPKRDGAVFGHSISPTVMAAFKKAIESNPRLSAKQKELLYDTLNQGSARMRQGNRARSIRTQKFMGADKNIARNIMNYTQDIGRSIAVSENQRFIFQAEEDLRDTIQRMSITDADKGTFEAVYKEVRLRLSQGVYEPNAPGKIMQAALTTTFLARLASPMYSVINAMQVSMVTLPYLGSKYGTGAAMTAINQAYAKVGLGNLVGLGIKNTAKGFRNLTASNINFDDPVGSLKTALAGQTEYLTLIDKLIEQGALDASAGIEVTQFDNNSKPQAVLNKADRIARQLPAVVEVINRSVSAIAAYDLAKRKGGSVASATQEALDTVRLTQGDYSASNAPRFFNNSILRPALQFKKYAQMMTYLLADAAHKSFAGATLEERRIARKQLSQFVAVQMLMAGAMGLPGLELLKVVVMLSAALGLTDSWDDYEEALRKFADDKLGKAFGQMLMSGVPTLGGYGIDISKRVSLADMWLFGEPKKADEIESIQAWAFSLLTGAPGGVATEAYKALGKVREQKYYEAMAGLPLPKFAKDSIKGIGGYAAGKDRFGRVKVDNPLELAGNIFGVRSARQGNESRETGTRIRERQDLERRSKELKRRYYNATSYAERVKAAKANKDFNSELEKSQWRFRLPTKVNYRSM